MQQGLLWILQFYYTFYEEKSRFNQLLRKYRRKQRLWHCNFWEFNLKLLSDNVKFVHIIKFVKVRELFLKRKVSLARAEQLGLWYKLSLFNNVFFRRHVLENRIRVSYAYSIFWRIRTYSNVFYYSVRVCSNFGFPYETCSKIIAWQPIAHTVFAMLFHN